MCFLILLLKKHCKYLYDVNNRKSILMKIKEKRRNKMKRSEINESIHSY